MISWVPADGPSDFPIENLPYGVFSRPGETPRVGAAIGDFVLELAGLNLPYAEDFCHPTLNRFMSRGRPAWLAVRQRLTDLLTNDRYRATVAPWLLRRDQVRLHLPFDVGDYVDFYASEHHASNVGRIFRPDGDPVTPNWKHLPIGYHGRSGTVVVSGTEIARPAGQGRAADGRIRFGPSQRLDIEAELGFVVGVPSVMGHPLGTEDFEDHVFGAVLVNDWSARDIQAWEYIPLGPFLGKSFATSISPWVVTLDALRAARLPTPVQEPAPLDYLRDAEGWALDVDFTIEWNGEVVSAPKFREMYWTPGQMLAHMTVNGASVRTGDLFASGTVSGPSPEAVGCLLELTWGGTKPVGFSDGRSRAFLADGDAVTIRATAPAAFGGRIGFGEVTGRVVPLPPSAEFRTLACHVGVAR